MSHAAALANAAAWADEARRLAEQADEEEWSTHTLHNFNAAVQLAQAYALIAQAARP